VTNVLSRCVYRAFRRDGEGRSVPWRAAVLATLLGLGAGGCSMSFPMASLVPEDEPKTTGAVVAKPASPLSPELGEEDWRRARGALAVALDPQGNGASVSWDNPDSGFKGAFTPVGQPFVKSDEICRAFLTSLASDKSNSSLQGTACRPSGGEWAIKDIRPWKKGA
jgi:surface antigen